MTKPSLDTLERRLRLAQTETPIGCMVQHYKNGNHYAVTDLSIREADGAVLITFRKGLVRFTRPLWEFNELIDHEGNTVSRFEVIEVEEQPAVYSQDLIDSLKTAGLWSRLRGQALVRKAAERISDLSDTCHDLYRRLAVQERFFIEELTSREKTIKQEANSLFQRTSLAIAELEKCKNNKRNEKAYAVILSPSQYIELIGHGAFRRSKIFGLNIYVARGVYGPVVLTEAGYEGFSRMAPELDIRCMSPAAGTD